MRHYQNWKQKLDEKQNSDLRKPSCLIKQEGFTLLFVSHSSILSDFKETKKFSNESVSFPKHSKLLPHFQKVLDHLLSNWPKSLLLSPCEMHSTSRVKLPVTLCSSTSTRLFKLDLNAWLFIWGVVGCTNLFVSLVIKAHPLFYIVAAPITFQQRLCVLNRSYLGWMLWLTT